MTIKVKEKWSGLEGAVVWIIYHAWVDERKGGLLDVEMRLSKIERSGVNFDRRGPSSTPKQG